MKNFAVLPLGHAPGADVPQRGALGAQRAQLVLQRGQHGGHLLQGVTLLLIIRFKFSLIVNA